jgi:hypothetical protein
MAVILPRPRLPIAALGSMTCFGVYKYIQMLFSGNIANEAVHSGRETGQVALVLETFSPSYLTDICLCSLSLSFFFPRV